MARFVIIADDLTGSNDTGVQFARRGVPTVISVDPEHAFDEAGEDAEVCVVDTESRHVRPAEAARRVEQVARAACNRGIGEFYKKTDSTLRGNVGVELAALLRATGGGVLPFVPAYPQAGRITRGGRHYVRGKPLHETFFAQDPHEPIASSSIPEILTRDAQIAVCVVAREELASWSAADCPDPCICVFDAENDDDLDRIADRLVEVGLLWRTAGAAGFAEKVAERLNLPRSAPETIERRGPLLIVNGSLQETALAQVRRGLDAGIEDLKLAPEMLLAGELSVPPVVGPLLLYTVVTPEERAQYAEAAGQHGIEDVCGRVAEAVGTLTADLMQGESAPGSLAVFGGDTAVAVLRALGCSTMRPHAELWPGVIESTMSLPARDVTVVTKSGGFGPEDLVQQLVRMYAG